jgi:hypothetical protein
MVAIQYNSIDKHTLSLWWWRQRQSPKRWILTPFSHSLSPENTSLSLEQFPKLCSVESWGSAWWDEGSMRKVQWQWLPRPAYLAYIFTHLNGVDVTPRRECKHFNATDKVSLLLQKQEFWTSSIEETIFDCFPLLRDLMLL